jgi:hypothetical protein
MGYVHDTAMAKWIWPQEFMHSAGTWTQKETATADVWCVERSAANATWNTLIPIKLPQNSVAGKGSKLVSVDVGFVITAAGGAVDVLAAAIYKVTKQADGGALAAGTSVTFTYDVGHDAAEERVDADEHWMTLTLSTPEWLDNDDLWFVEIAGDGSAGSIIEFLGARVNYTFRV